MVVCNAVSAVLVPIVHETFLFFWCLRFQEVNKYLEVKSMITMNDPRRF